MKRDLTYLELRSRKTHEYKLISKKGLYKKKVTPGNDFFFDNQILLN